jgi:DNA-binding beta-propeller fold protein YncE
MISKRILMVLVMLVSLAGSIGASQEYRVVKIWPEAPQGWHFCELEGVAVDTSGNVYVGDSGNYRIKKFDPEGRLLAQWGSPGQGNGQFNTICSVKVDDSGIVYVFDMDFGKWQDNRIQKFTPYGQFVGMLERKTPDANQIKLPIDLAFDNEGNVLVLAVDYRPKLKLTCGVRIEKYSRQGEFISQWGAEAGSGDGQLQRPNAIAVDAEGNVYIAEIANGRVQKFDSSGKFLMKWGSKWVGWSEGDGIFRGGARSITIDEKGDLYVLDYNSVQKFTPKGRFLVRWKTVGEQACRLAIDSHSNLYVTNMDWHMVTKLDPNGNVISQWGCAGTGDGQFNLPGSIAVNPFGHTFVADLWNYRIQRFDPEGRFVSRWGSEIEFRIEDVATDASGNIYIACEGSDEVQKFDPDGKLVCRWGSTGSGDGQFQFPSAVAVGPSGGVYVADADNYRVQKFTSDGKFLAKWGTEGTGDGQFKGAFFITVDGSGSVWVGDQLGNGTHRMQKFDSTGRFLTKWTKKIMTPPARLYCGAVAVDSGGNSYYAFENKVEKYDPQGDLVISYGQGGLAEDRLNVVKGLCVDEAGCLYVAGGDGSIRKFDANGKLASKWGTQNSEGQESLPAGPITVDRAGNVYVSHLAGVSIWKLSSDGRPAIKFRIEAPSREGRFTDLGGVTVDGSGRVYAVDSVDVDWEYGIPSIQKFDPNGQFITVWGVPQAAQDKFKYPARIAVDGSGNMYVTDQSSHCVHKLDAQGKYIKSWGSKGTDDGQFDTPEGIAVDKSGNVYVCDRQNCRIQKFDSDGRFLAKWGKEGSGDGEFHFPAAVALDKEGNVYVADSDNNRVQKFTAEGKFLTEWGEFGEAPGQFSVPLGIAVDAAGNVYVSDSHNHRIQKFAPINSR